MVVVTVVSIPLIWSFLAFISLFPNSLLLIWVTFCDKFPFATLLCCLTNTRLLVGSLARCYLKLHPVFNPSKNSHHGSVGFPFCFEGGLLTALFWLHELSWWSHLDTLVSAQVEKGFECIWSPVESTKTFGYRLQLRCH